MGRYRQLLVLLTDMDPHSAVHVIREQVAALDIDVVVLGVVQPKGLSKLLGDTTERMVSDPPCSVLSVHPCVIDTWEPTPCN